MVLTKQLVTLALLLSLYGICYAFPQHGLNPNLEYELISGGPQLGPKSNIVPTSTPKQAVVKTPPPPPADSKTFAFDPTSNSWTQVKKNDPIPAEDTLLWNQNNDKWLTRS